MRPKPMVEIGDRPILWHIMQHYSQYGHREFIVCLGYKGEQIKRYFARLAGAGRGRDHRLRDELGRGARHGPRRLAGDPRRHRAVDTDRPGASVGFGTLVWATSTFMMTYGDGVSDVDLDELVAFHQREGPNCATITAVRPPARFGKLDHRRRPRDPVRREAADVEGWINGGFFVLEPGVFDYIPGDVDFAREPLEASPTAGQLSAYRHEGFWQCMDTTRDRDLLNSLWDSGNPPWQVWTS